MATKSYNFEYKFRNNTARSTNQSAVFTGYDILITSRCFLCSLVVIKLWSTIFLLVLERTTNQNAVNAVSSKYSVLIGQLLRNNTKIILKKFCFMTMRHVHKVKSRCVRYF